VSVIPPGAKLSPKSTIKPEALGKTPGVKYSNGTWGGYSWLTYNTQRTDVEKWAQDGANIGILAGNFPGVDIDSEDEWLAKEVETIATQMLGAAPARIGKAPKRLLIYRTGEPFARMALIIRKDDKSHLIEVLGAGRQYLIHGQHPSGARYTCDPPLTEIDAETELAWITKEMVNTFLNTVQSLFEIIPGVEVERVGDGAIRERTTAPQGDLVAPSIEALQEAVAVIPNNDDFFPDRDDYVKMGYAIRAAAGDDEAGGYAAFAEWAGRHEKDGRVDGNPETWRADWLRMHGPFSVGWGWLTELASKFGFNSAQHEFTAVEDAPLVERDDTPIEYTDVWLAEKVVDDYGDSLRYVDELGKWYVWSDGMWVPDATGLAFHTIGKSLVRQASILMQRGATEKELAANRKVASKFLSTYTRDCVRRIVQTDPRIAARASAFDADPWVLNTPGGTVDLMTGEMRDHDVDDMCSKRTAVTPAFETEAPEWSRFLMEATGGDIGLQTYLQRLAGYALTGSVEEHSMVFIWGPGANGKSVFLNAIAGAMQDYAVQAPLDTFTSGNMDKHPTDLAGLMGSRLVAAAETQSGRRWDEQRIKSLTGGDLVRARFMRQDFFTYQPQFKLVFVGNHKPEIRDIDDAMRRRIHMVPFVVTPREIDVHLPDKLKAEYPAILAWAIRGCSLWQREGLSPPAVVVAATQEYFHDEDPVQAWIDDCCDVSAPEVVASTLDLFHSWEQWANERGEYVGTVKRLAQIITAKKFPKWRSNRERGFRGIAVIESIPFMEEDDG
jgi:P4 family phage/plasmid primase-like protien